MDNQNIAAPEKEACPYCEDLKKVNDPSEGSCPYCAAMQGEGEAAPLADCKYCAAMDDSAPCKYCDAMNAEPAASGCAYCADMAHRDQECQYCGEAPNTQNPTTTNSEDFAGQDLDSPAIPKPIMGEDPQGVAPSTDVPTTNNTILDNPPAAQVDAAAMDAPKESVQVDQSKEAMMNIAQQIEGDAGVGNGPGPQGAAAAQNTDQAALAVGTNMEDNISRPAGYGEDESDMGVGQSPQSSDSGGSPDLASVLHEGLDAHADNIQREKVVQMVSGALQGFKASKKIIELSQTQAPQLYQASIMMLKAMIEMAKMLGLGPQEENPADPASEWEQPFATHPDQGGQPQPGHAPSDANPAPAAGAPGAGDANNGNEWADPFATHPDQGGQPAPGHAPSSVGQPVGKLPTSATTEHVARTPLAPGAVNAQGQKKYVDPVTGEESFINMKEGRVLSNTGKPVKPSHQG